MNELVSIIMPTYNCAPYIASTIKSVLAQTYSNWELLIVDDCSADNTETIVSAFDDLRIFYFKNEVNMGAASSRNFALRQAKGKWVAFLDSDDLWMPDKLEKQLAFMSENHYDFSCTDYIVETSDGTRLPYIFTSPNKVTKRMLYNYCYFSTITVIYNRESVGLVQIANLEKNNDYAMWFQVAEKADCYRFPEALSVYRKRKGSLSSGSKFKLIKHHYYLFRIALDKPRIIACFLTLNNIFFGILKKLFYKKKM